MKLAFISNLLSANIVDKIKKNFVSKHFRWMPYKCVARNDDPRPTTNATTEMDIMFGKYTRQPEQHPFYQYAEVNVIQETCVQDQFNAQGIQLNKMKK